MMKIFGHSALALILTLSTALACAQTTLSTQGATAPSNSNAGRQLSTQSIRSAPKNTAPQKTNPQSQFMFDVLVGVNGSSYSGTRPPKSANGFSSNRAGHLGLKSRDFASINQKKSTEIAPALRPTDPATPSILNNSQTPAFPLENLSINRDDHAGLEIGIGISSKNGPNKTTLKPYYKRTPMNNADSLRELYGSKNSTQEFGIQLHSTF